MKKQIITLFGLLACAASYAQPKIVTTGNNLMNPSDPKAADILIGSDEGVRHDGSIMWWSNNSASRISNTNDVFYLSVWNTLNANVGLAASVGGTSYFQGMLGIGTMTPGANLEVKSQNVFDGATRVRITNNAGDYGRTNLILTGRFQDNNDGWNFGSMGRNSIVFAQNESSSGQNVGSMGDEKMSIQLEGNSNALGFLSKQNGSSPNMVLFQDGRVGIGTNNPDEKLTVKGGIHARSVKVDLNGPLADYVFEADYKLRSLSNLHAYIKRFHHLPEVPSAKEAQSNGLDLGTVNQILLKKVEELTLYLIEKDKQLNMQQQIVSKNAAINTSQQKAIKKLTAGLLALKRQSKNH